jgi:O-antigen/teichoic acid export membrane protein
MKIKYLIAVFANRGLGLICLLALSHLLDPSEFGQYSLIAINAVFLQTIMGAWISTATTRYISTAQPEDLAARVSQIAFLIFVSILLHVAGLLALAALSLTGLVPLNLVSVALTCCWSISLTCAETTLAAKNAKGDDNSYLLASVVRNVSGTLLAILLAISVQSGQAAAAGQIIGILLSLAIIPSTLALWRSAKAPATHPRISRAKFKELAQFGFAGTLALGFYIMTNAMMRNTIGIVIGAPAAGAYALVVDLMFGPITLLSNAYSLSMLRRLYLAPTLPAEDQIALHRAFLAINAFIAIPYGIGGVLIAPAIAKLIISPDTASVAASIAGLSAVHAAFATMLFAYMAIALTAGRKRRVAIMVAASLLFFGLGAGAGALTATVEGFMMAGTVACVASTIAAAMLSGARITPGQSYGRTMVASSIMLLALVLLYRLMPEDLSPLLKVGLGVSCGVFTYGAGAAILRPIPLPKAVFVLGRRIRRARRIGDP